MRLSADKNDPGYDPYRCLQYIPYLDGEEVDDCVTADEEKGEVVVFVRDRNNLVCSGPDRRPKTKVLQGKVELKLRSDL